VIEEILQLARFAPSGANIQPWHVYVLAGQTKKHVSAALLDAYRADPDQHISEYQYYASDLPLPYLHRRHEFGRLFYGSLGVAQTDMVGRAAQTARNFTFFDAPVGMIVTMDRRLAAGSFLDLGMFIQSVMLALVGRGLHSCPQETFAKYHRILRPLLSIPDEQFVVCGLSIGYAKHEARPRLMPRSELTEFACLSGFD